MRRSFVVAISPLNIAGRGLSGVRKRLGLPIRRRAEGGRTSAASRGNGSGGCAGALARTGRCARSLAAAAFILVFAGFLALPHQAQAQATTLVSNTGQTSTTSSGSNLAQAFTTGSHGAGYLLTSVGVELEGVMSSGVLTVRIFPNDGDGAPDDSDPTKWITLTSPASLTANSINTFTAPGNTTLPARTTYHVVISKPNSQSVNVVRIARTASTAEDSGAASGWSIANERRFRGHNDDPWTVTTSSFIKLRISGTAVADTAAPVLSSAIVDGTSLVLTYTEELDEDSVPSKSRFGVSVGGGTAATPSNVSVSGHTVKLTLAAAVAAGQSVTVSYTVPGGTNAAPIQDPTGNDAAGLTNQGVDHADGADLIGLTLEDGNADAVALSPTFATDTTFYTALVANAVDSVTLTATKSNASTAVVILNDDDSNSPGEAEFDLTVGLHVLEVAVTSEHGFLTRTYLITVARATVAGAKLSALSFLGNVSEEAFHFPLEPAFDPDTTEYTVHIPTIYLLYSLDYMRSDPAATIVINDELYDFDQGALENDLDAILRPGTNIITLTVTAQDGVTTRTYTITVKRGGGLKGKLQGVPDSHDGSTAFEVTLTFKEDITATLAELGEVINITNGTKSGLAAVGGSQRRFSMTITPSSSAPLRIHVRGVEVCDAGSYTYPLICTANFKPFRGISRWVSTADDARLRALWLERKGGGWLGFGEAFSPGTTSYVANAFTYNRELTLRAAPYNRGVTSTVTGPVGTFTATDSWDGGKTAQLDVPAGSTTWTVKVDSADGTSTKRYTITVNRDAPSTPTGTCYGNSPNADLESFTLTPVGGMLAPPVPSVKSWKGWIRQYTAYVTHATTNVNVSGRGVHADSSVSILTGFRTPLAQPAELKNVTWVAIRVRTEVDDKCYVSHYGLKIVRLRADQSSGATGVGPLMADFQGPPSSHDGSSAFSVWVVFSEDVEITPADMRDHALTVSGATVTGAAQVDGRKDLWELTLAPSGSGPVSILVLTGRACTEAGALCTADGRTLTTGLGLSVPGPVPGTAETTANTPATGSPSISGTAQVGETLTADTSGIADADGLANVSYSYQWVSNDGSSDTDITGATDSTYTLVAADEGKTIKVQATFTDDDGNEETLTRRSDNHGGISSFAADRQPGEQPCEPQRHRCVHLPNPVQ